MRDCRTNYLNQATLILDNEDQIDSVVLECVEKYNTSKKPILNDSTPYLVFFKTNFNLIKDTMSTKTKISYNDTQKYIEIIRANLKNKEIYSNSLDNLDIVDINEKFNLIKLNELEHNIKKKKEFKMPKRKRDLIPDKVITKVLDRDDIHVFIVNKVNKVNYKVNLQIKLLICLLRVTGCRVSELTKLSFKDIEKLLKESELRLEINKDNTSRIIPILDKK